MSDDAHVATAIPVKTYGKGDPLYVQAQRIWTILCSFVMARHFVAYDRRLQRELPDLLYYKDLATLMGKPGAQHTLDRQLGLVGKYCVVNGLPPLNVIVVNQETEMPGHGVVLRDGHDVKSEMQAVGNFDWFSVRVPTTGTFRKVYDLANSGNL